MNIVTKLAITRIKSKKARSFVICGAIFLTILLFMTIVCITVNIISGYSLMMKLASGTDYHGYLRTGTFSLTGVELRDKTAENESIREAVISSNLASYSVNESDLLSSTDMLRAVEKEADLQHFYTDIIEGAFPTSDAEVMVSPLFFPDVKIGDSVGLYYMELGDVTSSTAYAEFKVSGLIKSRTDTQLNVVMKYSDTLEEVYGFSTQYLNVYFMFDNTFNLTDKLDNLVNETLSEYKQSGYEVYGIPNPAYLESSVKGALNPTTVFLILFSVSVVFFCSFLLIYNIYSIALTQDMQSFGLLSVIGTTHKQIRKMICTESLILFTLTFPIGLTIGYFIVWKLLSPLLFSSLMYEGFEFDFSPWIPIFTLLLTLFTLLWSATRPLRKLRTMTPVSVVDYSPSTDLPKGYIRKKNYIKRNHIPTTSRLAAYSVSRSKKKAMITALSVSLSVTLFVLISTLCDYMVVYTESNLQFADYVFSVGHTYRYENDVSERKMSYSADGGIGINDKTVAEIEKSVYVEKVWKIRTAMTELTISENARDSLGIIRNRYEWFDSFALLSKALSGKIDALVISIPDELFPMIMRTEKEKFADIGDSVICNTCKGITDSDGNIIAYSYFNNGDTIKLGKNNYSVQISDAISPTMNITKYINTITYRAVIYMPESMFLNEFGEGLTYALLINAGDDCYDRLKTELHTYDDHLPITTDETIFNRYQSDMEASGINSETLHYQADINGRMDGMEQMKQTIRSLQTVGYSLVSMIFLIGVLNIVNTALSSVSERKREFAMLEAVGMTNSQLLRMLLAESLYSGSLAVLITVCVGFPIIRLIIYTAMNSLVSLNWISGVLMLLVCFIVSLASGAAVFRLTKSASVVERIKVE